MDINEFEAGMLDAVLEAFAGSEQLSKTQVLELFGDDEELAAAIVDVLVDFKLVTGSSVVAADTLPAFITRSNTAASFLAAGGFSGQLLNADEEEADEAEVKEIQAPVAPVNETPEPEADIHPEPAAVPEIEFPSADHEEPSEPEPIIELEDEVEQEPVRKSNKQTREVIFEVEFPNVDEPSVEKDEDEPIQFKAEAPEPRPGLTGEDQPPAHTIYHNDFIEDEIDEDDEPEIAPGQIIDEPETEPEPVKPEPVQQPVPELKQEFKPAPEPEPVPQPQSLPVIAPQEQVSPLVEEVKELSRELDKLRKDQMLTERKIREKDAMIHTLTDQNEQLGKLRLFIWVLLGLVAVLVIGMLLKK